ncbi:MAG: FecR domain-containing protein [Undibacterium curvum]|uniref:FecR domain-containing protein n=1 Tax=Undibacterium curvum TaxID=2762294 RepID=UPI003BC0A517
MSFSPSLLRKLQASVLFAMTLSLSSVAVAAQPRGEPGTVIATPPDMTYYALQGDTLLSIAKRFTNQSQNWSVLSKKNQIIDDRAIPIGTAIRIPLDLLPEVDSEAKVVALAGNPVYKSPNSGEANLTIGVVLKEGTQILTGKNGFVTLALPDESRISIPSNSQVVLSKLRKTQYTSSPRTELSLIEGKVESRVTSLSTNKGRFEVRSPLAIAGVRGTHFRVGVSDNGTANEVLEGGVAVDQAKAQKAAKLTLGAGKGNIVNASGVGKPVDLLPAPVLEEGSRLQIRPTMQFQAQAMPAAQAWRVQVSKDVQALDVVMENRFKDPRFKFGGLDDGDYFLRVAAIDQHGLEGIPLIQSFTLKARPEPPFTSQPKNKIRADKVDFSWTEAANADNYRVQIAKDSDFKTLVHDEAGIRNVHWTYDKLADGDYYWRIATVAQKNGKPDQGPFSDAQKFQKLPPQGGASFADSEGKDITLSWPAEPGQTFLVQLAADKEFTRLLLSKELTQAELKLPRPAPGDYFIRVKATDPDGFVGNFSGTQKINISARWTTSDGEALRSAAGVVKTGY